MKQLSKRERAYVFLKHQIVCGFMRPGSSLEEKRIADKLGTSLTPVKQALDQLTDEGFVRLFPRKGRLVAELSSLEVRHLTEARLIHETKCAGLCAQRRDGEVVRRLSVNIERLRDLGPEAACSDYIENDLEFHEIVTKGTSNTVLEKIASNIHERLALHLVEGRKLDNLREKALTQHIEIFDAISAGNAGKAEKAMIVHLMNSFTGR